MPATHRICVLATLLLSVSLSMFAEDLGALVQELVKNSPEIRAARYRYDAASKRPSQVGALPDPRIQVVNEGVGHPFSGLNKGGFAYQAFGFSQEVPFPGKLALASEEAKHEADSEMQSYQSLVLRTTSKLKIAYFDWFYFSKALELVHKNRDLLERFEAIARARYSVGKSIQQDVLKAQVELAALVQQSELLEQRRASAEALIESLLNRPPGSSMGQPAEIKRSPFDLDLNSITRIAEQNSPELRARQYQVDSRAVGIERARKDYRPDFNFNFQWQHTGSNFPDYYMASAEVKIPLYFWRKQRYAGEEAESRFQEARQTYQSNRQEILFNAKDQYLVAKTSERLLALYESGIIPQASLSLESTLAAYEVGNIDFLSLLTSQSSLLNFEMQYYEELAKHEQALARLEPLLNRTLAQP